MKRSSERQILTRTRLYTQCSERVSGIGILYPFELILIVDKQRRTHLNTFICIVKVLTRLSGWNIQQLQSGGTRESNEPSTGSSGVLCILLRTPGDNNRQEAVQSSLRHIEDCIRHASLLDESGASESAREGFSLTFLALCGSWSPAMLVCFTIYGHWAVVVACRTWER